MAALNHQCMVPESLDLVKKTAVRVGMRNQQLSLYSLIEIAIMSTPSNNDLYCIVILISTSHLKLLSYKIGTQKAYVLGRLQ